MHSRVNPKLEKSINDISHVFFIIYLLINTLWPQRIYKQIDDEKYMTYIIDGLFKFWIDSTMHVQNTIKPGRITVFRLSEIDTYLPHLALLAGIPSDISLKLK